MADVGMANDGTGHVHTWERGGGACVCGQPVPPWLRAAWDRYAQNTGGDE